MERKRNSTADLLSWPENPQPPEETQAPSPAPSHQQPYSDGISKVVFGGQVTDEEFQSSFNKLRKPVSGYKLKDITATSIFTPASAAAAAAGDNNTKSNNLQQPNKTGLRMAAGLTHTSFSGDELVHPQKAHSQAKQRELGGTLDNDLDSTFKKQFTTAKNKELSGHDIFAPPPQIQPRPLAARALALRESISIGESAPTNTNAEESVKTAKKIPSEKFTELSGNNIFKGDKVPASTEKHRSSAKLREMSGSNIFADGKAESRDHLRGVRKPPGGESSISLV
ncbi:hypothetical protein M8C21_031518 [Ambrosia artemisiifolia]|uniref:DUF4057 domain-containing protein n=1 Tax=Ambrosia artemisiifolia TaxID=4212 RepID=A0AAD5CUH0_AMBAR|nr:hypothetical protein M8C21_031518 [Ambrosia artemisiifolia]